MTTVNRGFAENKRKKKALLELLLKIAYKEAKKAAAEAKA